MKTITVMTNNKSIKPVGDGELSEEIITNNRLGKNIEKYLTPDYCLSCAYFQQTKGNFGRCTVLKNDKKFDGSKKDSACNCWRLESSLIQIINRPKIIRKESDFEVKIKEHNYNSKLNLKIKQIKNQQTIKKDYEHSNYKYGLPYGLTSDIMPSKKIYKSHAPYSVIKHTVVLMSDNSLSMNDIRKQIKKTFGRNISLTSIRKWALKYKPDKIWYVRKPSNFRIVSDVIRLSLRGLSLGDIALFIHQNHNLRLSPKSIRDIQNKNGANIIMIQNERASQSTADGSRK